MIGYLRGKLLYTDGMSVILDVGGVGYEINCSASLFNEITQNGKEDAFIYMAVKEDGVSLYGFVSPEEKAMFLKLITVSGVGAKMGITVLSNMSLNDLAISIASSDVKTLSQIKGLGKKTAERIILELREKINADTSTAKVVAEQKSQLNDEDNDVIIALMSLGFNKGECIKALEKAKESGATGLKQLIAVSLRNIK